VPAAFDPQLRPGDLHRPLQSVVYEEIRGMILRGELLPGTRLVEDRLAERLGVSRNPVREALRVLAAEGFVEVLPRRGAAVATLGADEAEELFDVRMALESLAARLAARRVDSATRRSLEHILHAAEAAASSGDQDSLVSLNARFHEAVVELSGNTYLRMVAAPVLQRARWLYQQSLPVRAAHSWTEHVALARAILSGDEVAAEAHATTHVAAARAAFRSVQEG
jgi:DNA-binding GntR family transcriptional regulator